VFSLVEDGGCPWGEDEVVGDVLRLDVQLYLGLTVSVGLDVIPLHA
jgi:hypothetical protein